jgi:hypothetical protein
VGLVWAPGKAIGDESGCYCRHAVHPGMPRFDPPHAISAGRERRLLTCDSQFRKKFDDFRSLCDTCKQKSLWCKERRNQLRCA